jgi:hypothetical protein
MSPVVKVIDPLREPVCLSVKRFVIHYTPGMTRSLKVAPLASVTAYERRSRGKGRGRERRVGDGRGSD